MRSWCRRTAATISRLAASDRFLILQTEYISAPEENPYMKTRLMALCLLVALVAPAAHAHRYHHGDLIIDHPWSRPTPPGTPMGAGYMSITNEGSEDAVLESAESPRTGHVSIHESYMHEGIMRMQPVKGGLVIPAGETVELRPHSYHLMLEQLREPLQEGEQIPVVLRFRGMEPLEVELKVEPLDGAPAMDHGEHSQHMEHHEHGHTEH